MLLIMVNQTVPKYINCLPTCSPFLEQDEPVREEHPDVPDRCEPCSLHPGNAHHEKQSQPEGQYSSGLLFDNLRY
jgi:hypothetical protein